jgi:hypothetical protein
MNRAMGSVFYAHFVQFTWGTQLSPLTGPSLTVVEGAIENYPSTTTIASFICYDSMKATLSFVFESSVPCPRRLLKDIMLRETNKTMK